MFKGLKNLAKGVYSPKALKNSFIVNYHRYLQDEEEGIADIIKSQSENVFEIVLKDAEKCFEEIGSKETRIEQIQEMRRTIIEYLEERIQCQIYFDEKWTENQRKEIGQYLLLKLEEVKIPDQERSIYIISTIAFFVFYLVSVELYKDKNSWINDYTDLFRSYAELCVNISMEEDPMVRDSMSRLREPALNSLLEWQNTNVYGS
jgi:hypothetical protein